MVKLEVSPSREGGGENGRGGNEAGENISLSEFNSNPNRVEWRTNNLFPLLSGLEETNPSATRELMLNGSQHFLKVYGRDTEASAFQDSVDGTFQFVTNVTQYHHYANSGRWNVAQSDGAAEADASRTGPAAMALNNAGGEALLSSSASAVTPKRQSPEQSHMPSAAADLTARNPTSGADSSLREPSPPLLLMSQSMQSGSAPLPDVDPPPRSAGLPAVHGADHAQISQALSEPQSLGFAAQGAQLEEESGDVFSEVDEARRGEGGEVVARPSSCKLLILSMYRRRHVSVEVLLF